MRVALFPGDKKAVGHQRLIWPAEAAKAAGVQTSVSMSLPVLRAPYPDGRIAVRPGNIQADVAVFQRPSNEEIVALIPLFQAQGIAVVVDVDDDISCVPRQNPVWGMENHRMILRACQAADLVTVSTPALARRYASHGRYALLRNCVREELLEMNRTSDGNTIGWGGWAGTHPGDLEATHGGVAEAIRRTGARFHVVGPDEFVQQRLGLAEEPTATGPLKGTAELEYERALGMLDVGIVPLADTKFNQAKSWLKGLQYAARGVPFVASAIAEYEELAWHRVGETVQNRGRSWRSKLVELFDDSGLRDEATGDGGEFASEWTFTRRAHQWAEAWQKAYVRRLRECARGKSKGDEVAFVTAAGIKSGPTVERVA